MTNPPYIMDHLDEIAKILNHDRVYAFLHVPVQSGSDAVLRDMKREYNCDEFARVVNVLRKKVTKSHVIPLTISSWLVPKGSWNHHYYRHHLWFPHRNGGRLQRDPGLVQKVQVSFFIHQSSKLIHDVFSSAKSFNYRL